MIFSIITCTYNPDLPIFNRLVDAVNNLETNEDLSFEWTIVDNNSKSPVSKISFIQKALENNKQFKVVIERNPGLTYARIGGIKQAKSDWVIFFDDDNEPQSDYLINANKIINSNPQVGCWGPGNISVEFCGKESNSWVLGKRNIFQERHFKEERIGSKPFWQEDYPIGTGLICNKTILADYVNLISEGRLATTDRKGGSLSSGGDIQIVLLGIMQGFSVGSSPQLKLNHLIANSKATFRYLVRLEYGTNSSYIAAFNEVFTNKSIPLANPNNRDILLQYYYFIKMFLIGKLSFRESVFKLSGKLGQINAHYIAKRLSHKPVFIRVFEKIFKAHV